MSTVDLRTIVLATSVLCIVGCGTSGSNPPVLPEVKFVIGPRASGAPFSFTVQTLFAGGVSHTFSDVPFTSNTLFNIFLEGASQPYGGTFARGSDSGDIGVQETIVTEAATDQITTTAFTNGTAPVSVVIPVGAPIPTMLPAPNPEVRFDVCIPSSSAQASCFVAGDSGIGGEGFTGSVGDAFFTHLLIGATPSIYFLEGARDTVNGVFHADTSGQALLVQLFINGELKDTGFGTGDVVVRHDL